MKSNQTIQESSTIQQSKTIKPLLEGGGETKELYQNLLTNYGFKTVFTKKRFLIPFLNELLPSENKIEDIKYLKSKSLGKSSEESEIIPDVYCITNAGERILLEMQYPNQYCFTDRSVYYAFCLVRKQDVDDLQPTYVINILNFVPEQMRDDDSPISIANFRNIDTNELCTDLLNIVNIMLPKFQKSANELESPMDYWLYAITHVGMQMDEDVLRKEKLFSELLDEIDLNKLSKVEMKKYQESKKYRGL